MRIGVPWLASLRSASKVLASTRYPERISSPASVWRWRSPTCSAIAAPCEKPASTIRSAGIPRSFSRCSSASTSFAERRMSASLSRSELRSSVRMSYQAGITQPPLIVTGCEGACGNTKRSRGWRSMGTMGSKSWPSAPRPCSHTTEPRGSPSGSISTQGRISVIGAAL